LINYIYIILEKYVNVVFKGFPGLFFYLLSAGCCQHYIHPKNPNKKPESFVFLHTSWATRQVILALQQSTGTLIDLTGIFFFFFKKIKKKKNKSKKKKNMTKKKKIKKHYFLKYIYIILFL